MDEAVQKGVAAEGGTGEEKCNQRGGERRPVEYPK